MNIVITALLFLVPVIGQCRYALVEIEKVPITRLIANLEKQIGVLSGDELIGLAIWHDANSNGVSEPGEVGSLDTWGITALSCRYETHQTGIPFSPQGVRFKDGHTRPSFDWIAHSRSK